MKVKIEQELFNSFPHLSIGYLVIRNVEDTALPTVAYQQLEERYVAMLREKVNLDNVNTQPAIRLWQDIYRAFDINPKKFTPTVEALVKRVLKDKPMPWISAIVNYYLLAELQYLVPFGGYDLDKLTNEISLRFSGGNEFFKNLQDEAEFTLPGELVYADGQRVLTRKWNYRDCMETQITPQSRNVLLMVESPVTETHAAMVHAVITLAGWLKAHGNCEVETGYINRPEYEIQNIKLTKLAVLA